MRGDRKRVWVWVKRAECEWENLLQWNRDVVTAARVSASTWIEGCVLLLLLLLVIIIIFINLSFIFSIIYYIASYSFLIYIFPRDEQQRNSNRSSRTVNRETEAERCVERLRQQQDRREKRWESVEGREIRKCVCVWSNNGYDIVKMRFGLIWFRYSVLWLPING